MQISNQTPGLPPKKPQTRHSMQNNNPFRPQEVEVQISKKPYMEAQISNHTSQHFRNNYQQQNGLQKQRTLSSKARDSEQNQVMKQNGARIVKIIKCSSINKLVEGGTDIQKVRKDSIHLNSNFQQQNEMNTISTCQNQKVQKQGIFQQQSKSRRSSYLQSNSSNNTISNDENQPPSFQTRIINSGSRGSTQMKKKIYSVRQRQNSNENSKNRHNSIRTLRDITNNNNQNNSSILNKSQQSDIVDQNTENILETSESQEQQQTLIKQNEKLLAQQKKQADKTDNGVTYDEVQVIPKNLTITQQQMKERKYMDQRRWFSISRPQYPRSCGISSLTSCFNYLFSTLGCGDLPPISCEEAIEKLGCVKGKKNFKDVDFGAFTGNWTLIKWWKRLLKIYGQEGSSYMFWKAKGQDQTRNRNADQALTDMKKGLQGENMAFIYHAYDHYFCPIGFEETPGKAVEAYTKRDNLSKDRLESWIIIGETARNYPCFHTKKWSEISMDIQLEGPNYYNIREPQKGIMQRKKKSSGNMHCIMAFTKRTKKISYLSQKQQKTVPKEVYNYNINNAIPDQNSGEFLDEQDVENQDNSFLYNKELEENNDSNED